VARRILPTGRIGISPNKRSQPDGVGSSCFYLLDVLWFRGRLLCYGLGYMIGKGKSP
jgi:hypothetical protein